MKRSTAGFSLLELAIVMTVIGLIVGAIAFGHALIVNGGTRSYVADIEHYSQAVNTFQEKYSGLPGDLSNAESYWGHDALDGCAGSGGGPASYKTATCNGDGNGQLGNQGTEVWTAWVQMSDAGVIGGSFTGEVGSATGGVQFGQNSPSSRVTGIGFFFLPFLGNSFAGNANYYAGDYGNVSLALSGATAAGLLTSDAYGVDSKLDDGRPLSGRIESIKGTYGTTTCVSGQNYNIVNTTATVCGLLIDVTD